MANKRDVVINNQRNADHNRAMLQIPMSTRPRPKRGRPPAGKRRKQESIKRSRREQFEKANAAWMESNCRQHAKEPDGPKPIRKCEHGVYIPANPIPIEADVPLPVTVLAGSRCELCEYASIADQVAFKIDNPEL